jgi:hypothetical protein
MSPVHQQPKIEGYYRPQDSAAENHPYSNTHLLLELLLILRGLLVDKLHIWIGFLSRSFFNLKSVLTMTRLA